jgi:hypothetical protein
VEFVHFNKAADKADEMDERMRSDPTRRGQDLKSVRQKKIDFDGTALVLAQWAFHGDKMDASKKAGFDDSTVPERRIRYLAA